MSSQNVGVANKKSFHWSHDFLLRKKVGKKITVFLGDNVAFSGKLLNSDKWSLYIEITSEEGDVSELVFFKHSIDGFQFEEI